MKLFSTLGISFTKSDIFGTFRHVQILTNGLLPLLDYRPQAKFFPFFFKILSVPFRHVLSVAFPTNYDKVSANIVERVPKEGVSKWGRKLISTLLRRSWGTEQWPYDAWDYVHNCTAPAYYRCRFHCLIETWVVDYREQCFANILMISDYGFNFTNHN